MYSGVLVLSRTVLSCLVMSNEYLCPEKNRLEITELTILTYRKWKFTLTAKQNCLRNTAENIINKDSRRPFDKFDKLTNCVFGDTVHISYGVINSISVCN